MHVVEQRLEAGNDPGVERRGGGAHPVIDAIGHLMAAGHGEAGFLLDDGFDLEFVGGVDVAGVARHGECGDPILLD